MSDTNSDRAGSESRRDQIGTRSGRPEQEEKLERSITGKLLFFYVLGDVLGSGIYALIGVIALEVGGAFWMAFVVGVTVAMLTGFAYAELITKYPQAAGAALYVHKAFGNRILTFIVTFCMLAASIAAAGALALVFGGPYFQEFLDVPSKVTAVVFIILLAPAQLPGNLRIGEGQPGDEPHRGLGAPAHPADRRRRPRIRRCESQSALRVQRGQHSAGDPGRRRNRVLRHDGLRERSERGRGDAEPEQGLSSRAAGWHGTGRPHVSAGGLHRLDGGTPRRSCRVQQRAARGRQGRPHRRPGEVFSAIALVAVTNTTLVALVAQSRIMYGMGRQGVVPRVFSRTHHSRHTPWISIIFTTAIVVVLLLTTDVNNLATVTVLFLIAVYGMVCLAALILRKDRVNHDHYQAPTFLLYLGVAANVALLGYTAVTEPEALVYCGVMLAIGGALYIVNNFFTSPSSEPDESYQEVA